MTNKIKVHVFVRPTRGMIGHYVALGDDGVETIGHTTYCDTQEGVMTIIRKAFPDCEITNVAVTVEAHGMAAKGETK